MLNWGYRSFHQIIVDTYSILFGGMVNITPEFSISLLVNTDLPDLVGPTMAIVVGEVNGSTSLSVIVLW